MPGLRGVQGMLFVALFGAATATLASEAVMADLLRRCAPGVSPETLGRIVSVESRGQAYAIADAGPRGLPWSVRKTMVRSFFPKSKAEAVDVVRKLQAANHTVSIGLGQVNDQHLIKRRITVEDLLDPCTNLRVGASILQEFYSRASREFGPGQTALLAAISAYNSGSWQRGFAEGYVGLVRTASATPALKAGDGAGGLLPVPAIDVSAAALLPRPAVPAPSRLKQTERQTSPGSGMTSLSSRNAILRRAAMTPLMSKFEHEKERGDE